MSTHGYVAHPLGAGDDREKNRLNASRWCAWLAESRGIVPVAPWIILSAVWSEDLRELGLSIDFRAIERCDVIYLVGGRVSPGMALERAHAENVGCGVIDWTDLGYEPPARGVVVP